MKITQEEVTHVANLSKLKFSEEDTAALRQHSQKLLIWSNCSVKSTQLVLYLLQRWLTVKLFSDLMWPKKEQTVTACLKNVPEKDNYYIKVPAILDDGGDA